MAKKQQKRPSSVNSSGNRGKQPSTSRPKSKGVKRPSSPRPSGSAIRSNISSSSSRKSTARSTSKPKQSANKPISAAAIAAQTQTQSDSHTVRLSSAQARSQRLAGLVALGALFDHLEDVTSSVGSLGSEIADVRARGYRYGRDWEETTDLLRSRWPQQRREATRLLQDQRRVLQNASNEAQRLLNQAEHNTGLIDTVDNRLWALENQVNEAQRTIRGVYDSTEQEIDTLMGEVNKVRYLLDVLDDASFELYPDEHGIAVCKAQWTSDHQQPEGLLFLTNNRVIFEQREERVTKKVLFIATEKKLVQEMLWNAPIGAVTETELEDKKGGFLGMGRQEMLTLRFPERTRELPSDAELHLKGGATNEEWRSLIRKVKSGQIEADMFGAPSPQEQLAAEVEAEAEAEAEGMEKELPTNCPGCNATLPPIYKGMQQVECEYCGAVVNI